MKNDDEDYSHVSFHRSYLQSILQHYSAVTDQGNAGTTGGGPASGAGSGAAQGKPPRPTRGGADGVR